MMLTKAPHFALLFNVSKAHRRVAVLECEWGRQACQEEGGAARRKRAVASGVRIRLAIAF